MFDGTNFSLILDVDQDNEMFGSLERSLTHRCILVDTNRDITSKFDNKLISPPKLCEFFFNQMKANKEQ